MNFAKIQEKIVAYIENDFEQYLAQYGIPRPAVSTDFMDLDKHKNSFSVFLDFSKITFERTKFATDCCEPVQLSMSFYLVHRNQPSEKLRNDMMNAASAFYSLLKDYRGANAVEIRELNNYNIVEGTKFITISEFSVKITN